MPLSMIVVHTSTSNRPSQKSTHHLLQRALVHLAVGDGDARLGHQLAQRGGGHVDGLHAVVHPEHLALAQQLAADRLDGDALVVAADEGEDRLAVGRRGLQQRQVADADEAHLERARDGRGGQREHVDVVFSFFIASLACTPKRCSSSTTSRPRSLNTTPSCSRRWVPMTQSTSPVFSPSMTFFASFAVRKRLSTSTRIGIAGEAVGERVAVLGGEQRGGREHGDLLAVLDRLERGADGHLGLAEADVAAHQAVHRVGALHVGLDVVDRLALVGRLDVGERLLHLVLPRRVVAERVARRR